jgi:hypothetical protein
LNNCRNNLRRITKQQNSMNRKVASNNKSDITGVHIFKGKYIAQITHLGKKYSLGTFLTLNEAVFARCKAKEQCFKEFARH